MTIATVAFDIDDTLWHDQHLYILTQDRFAALFADHAERDHLAGRLLACKSRNLGRYGYGIEGFGPSMIETATQVTDQRVRAEVIRQILDTGQGLLRDPVKQLPHARTAVETMAATHQLFWITRGDLLDQARKPAQSGLGEPFDRVEFGSAKTPQRCARLFGPHADGADRALMVGDSMKSDVLPMLQAGGWGIRVPFHPGWALEHADPPKADDRFRVLTDLAALPWWPRCRRPPNMSSRAHPRDQHVAMLREYHPKRP